MRIDIIFDTICPWCFIGKRRLEKILAQRQAVQVELCWRPFLLNPDMPPHGIERRVYLEHRFGSESRVNCVFNALCNAGRMANISFAFERITRTPATFDSHRLIRFAARCNRQTEVVEILFRAYFLEGADIGERKVLCSLAARAGLDPVDVRSYLNSETDLPTILSESIHAHRLGVNGVPCFIFNEAYAVAGAQETEALLRLFDLAGAPYLLPPRRGAPLLVSSIV